MNKLDPNSWAAKLLTLHNKARVNLPPLKLNSNLAKAAQSHSMWMAKNNKLTHDEDGISFIERYKQHYYTWTYAGENIASGYTTPDKVVRGWLKSPGHKANIINIHYRDVGFGYAESESGVKYWTADFGYAPNKFIAWFSPQQDAHLPDGLNENTD